MLERDAHVGEDAELYALGQLEELETAWLERHVRECAQCAARVGEAESTVLRLIESEAAGEAAVAPRKASWQPPRKRAYNPWMGAVAAAFALGLVPWVVSVTRHPGENVPPQFSAQTAMLDSHFLHAPFVAATADAPEAKVIYARNGGWYYVLAAGGSRPLDVVLIAQSGKRSYVALLPAVDQTRTAFVRAHGIFEAVELDDAGTPVATVKLVYPR
jgi:hypothetical protein